MNLSWMKSKRHKQVYDHRLVLLVQQTGDAKIATRPGAPGSTVAGWLAPAPRAVTTDAVADDTLPEPRTRIARLENRYELLKAFLRVPFAVLRILKPDLSRLRVPAPEKARLLRAIHRIQGVLGLSRVLAIVGLSASRLRAWPNAEQGRLLDDYLIEIHRRPHEVAKSPADWMPWRYRETLTLLDGPAPPTG